MTETIFISTHRLPVAGRLRESLTGLGYEVDLVPTPSQMEGHADPVLLILTGTDDAVEWARVAHQILEIPVFTVFPGQQSAALGRRLGAEEAFGGDPDTEELALLARRTIERRRLQNLTGVVGESDSMREVLERVVQIAPVDSTVLITGESGTGKELVARGIHALSPRRHKAFLAVNVAALSETLLESELFGHEKGAFTGAIDSRKGFFELADRGTLFLDEIGEMPLTTQTKLLRVLEQHEFLRVGGQKPIRVDVRIIAATNQELRDLVPARRFRRDLFYRLNILGIELPPLRRRRDDIPRLVHHFVRELTHRLDREFPGISEEAMDLLVRYDWPGNVRELRNLVESMVVLAPSELIEPDDLPREIRVPILGRRLLPAPAPTGAEAAGQDAASEGDETRRLPPELEFVFRTLVELKVDMDELRRDFERYREEVHDRLGDSTIPLAIPALSRRGLEVGFIPGSEHRPIASLGEGVRDEDLLVEPEGETVLFRPGMTMEDVEREAIRAVLKETDGNRRKAAKSLGIGERTLYRKIQKYEIEE